MVTEKKFFCTGSGRIELRMTLDQAQSASHSGQCYDDVIELLKDKSLVRQLSDIDPELLKSELAEYGAWDDTELSSHCKNIERIVWLAACDIVEGTWDNQD